MTPPKSWKGAAEYIEYGFIQTVDNTSYNGSYGLFNKRTAQNLEGKTFIDLALHEDLKEGAYYEDAETSKSGEVQKIVLLDGPRMLMPLFLRPTDDMSPKLTQIDVQLSFRTMLAVSTKTQIDVNPEKKTYTSKASLDWALNLVGATTSSSFAPDNKAVGYMSSKKPNFTIKTDTTQADVIQIPPKIANVEFLNPGWDPPLTP